MFWNSFLLLGLILASATPGRAFQAGETYNVSLFGGPAMMGPVLNVVKFHVPELYPRYFAAVAVERRVYSDENLFSLGVEGQVGKHFERADLFEFTPVLVTRLLKLPWSRVMPTTFAMGNGISVATGSLDVEKLVADETPNLLYHFFFEFTFGLFSQKNLTALFRVHHRSGVFGLIGNGKVGSNFLCLGLKYGL